MVRGFPKFNLFSGRSPVLADGEDVLKDILKQAGLPTPAHAVAALTAFTHPDTVKQTQNRGLFRITRDPADRGKITRWGGIPLMNDDGKGAIDAFLWANGLAKTHKNFQFVHIYKDDENPDLYTNLANLCAMPAFMARFVQVDPEIQTLLRYRALDLFKFCPLKINPRKPRGYDALPWHPLFPPIPAPEAAIRARMKTAPYNRLTIAAREIGWHFSDNRPDGEV